MLSVVRHFGFPYLRTAYIATDQLGWLFTFPTRHRGRGFGWKIAATRGGPKIAAIHRDFARSRRATLSREPITAEYHPIG